MCGPTDRRNWGVVVVGENGQAGEKDDDDENKNDDGRGGYWDGTEKQLR